MDTNTLKESFAALPELAPHTTWDQHRASLRKHVEKDDIERFLRWSTIQATMFVGNAPYIRKEYDDLVEQKKWGRALVEPRIGSPRPLPYAVSTSGNLVHQAYHLKQWMDRSDKDLSELETIVEFGGGYGAMAMLCSRMGFKGTYIIYDLPEFSLLQHCYLNAVGVKVHYVTHGNLDAFPAEASLVIALYSLSEIPEIERATFLGTVASHSYLLTYQHAWDGIDNHKNFSILKDTREDLTWHNWYITHQSNNWYLVGV